jgi:hypothetical protein
VPTRSFEGVDIDTWHMRYLVATDSVHTTAAACDYLEH